MNHTNDIHPGNKYYHKPFFLITIDTEGDNLWSRPRMITTRNAEFLPRFQSLCESYGLKPTYLTNYEMAESPSFQDFGKGILKRKTAEIGMHLHAWNTPPLISLTKDDFLFHPYLVEYPKDVMREKITVMTDLLEDTFGMKIISHRAGRWSFNETYAQILVEKGYRIDCSVTPYVSWKHNPGDPKQDGGTDYSQFPDEAYFLDQENISFRGDSSLLEIPVTIVSTQRFGINLFHRAFKNFSLAQRALNHLFPSVHWLRPNGRNLSDLLHIVRQANRDKRSYIEVMLHSSELMPRGSPTFTKDKDIEALYDDLDILFGVVHDKFIGATLTEYYQWFMENKH